MSAAWAPVTAANPAAEPRRRLFIIFIEHLCVFFGQITRHRNTTWTNSTIGKDSSARRHQSDTDSAGLKRVDVLREGDRSFRRIFWESYLILFDLLTPFFV